MCAMYWRWKVGFAATLISAFSLGFALDSAVAQTGSVKTQAQLNTEIGTTGCMQPTCLYPDNQQGLITPLQLRQGLLDITATLFGVTATACPEVKGDGSTDNSAFIAACIASANAVGNTAIIFPTGIIPAPTLSATVSGVNIWLVCQGGPGSCVLKGGVNGVLTWTGAYGGALNMGFSNSGAATNTTIVVNSFATQFLNIFLDANIGTFAAFNSVNSSTITFNNIFGNVGNSNVPLFTLSSGAGFILLNSQLSTGVSAGAGANNRFLISAAGSSFDTITMNGNLVQNFGGILGATAGNGVTISNIFSSNNVFDGMGQGFQFVANGTGIFYRIDISDRWITGQSGIAISFSGAGTFDNIKIDSAKIVNAGTSGIISTASGTFTNVKITGNVLTNINSTSAVGTADGINLAGGAGYSNISIIGNAVGAVSQAGTQPKNGCIFGAAIDHLTFNGNDCLGTTANYQGMLAGTSTTFAHTNTVQRSNVGLADAPGYSTTSTSTGLGNPAPTANGQAFLGGATDNGAVLMGRGSSADISLANKNGTIFCQTGTGSTTLTCTNLTLTNPLILSSGGTGISSGTSGGIPYFSSTTNMASSGLLTANCIVYGGGAGTAPATSSSNCPTVSSAGLVTIPNTTETSSLTTGSLQLAGGLAIGKGLIIGDAWFMTGYTANCFSQSSLNGHIACSPAKATAANTPLLQATSNDASNALQGFINLVTDPTAGNRRMTIQSVEIGVANRGVSINDGGAGFTTIGCTLGAVITASDQLSVCGQMSVNSAISITYIQAGTKMRAVGAAPALTSCGTSPTIEGSDLSGTVTMGTGSPTGCVITFNAAYSNAPRCSVTWRVNIASMQYVVSTTAITLTQTATSSNVVDYICTVRSGGWLLKRDLDPATNDNTPAFMDQAA
jgi:hypothetical protein